MQVMDQQELINLDLPIGLILESIRTKDKETETLVTYKFSKEFESPRWFEYIFEALSTVFSKMSDSLEIGINEVICSEPSYYYIEIYIHEKEN